jgi:hypothetical protein
MSSAQERGSSHPEPADVNSMPLLEAALAYAAMGLPVFPLHSPVFDAAGTFVRCDCREGAQCKDPGKHPWTLHGLSSAASDTTKVATSIAKALGRPRLAMTSPASAGPTICPRL